MLSKTLSVLLVVYLFSDFSHGQRAKTFFRKDYHYMESFESFYKFQTIPRTWADAKRVCALEGATLWYPVNKEEAHELLSFSNKTKPVSLMFLGLSDILVEGLFETVDGTSSSEVYSNWQRGQPDNYLGKQDCAVIFLDGAMDDSSCDSKFSFICKKSLQSLEWNYQCNVPNLGERCGRCFKSKRNIRNKRRGQSLFESPYNCNGQTMRGTYYTYNKDNGKCYKLHASPLSWSEAYAVCQLEQSSLAVVSNRLEADYLAKLTESTQKPRIKGKFQRGIYHLGFHNRFNETWQTVTGIPMDVDEDIWYDKNRPDGNDPEECGSMLYTGRLINIDCDTRSFFICEHEVDHCACNQQSN